MLVPEQKGKDHSPGTCNCKNKSVNYSHLIGSLQLHAWPVSFIMGLKQKQLPWDYSQLCCRVSYALSQQREKGGQ